MRISDWSSDVCSSDLAAEKFGVGEPDPLDLLPIGLGGGVPATANDRRLQPIAALGIGIHFGRGNEADVRIVDERTLAIEDGSDAVADAAPMRRRAEMQLCLEIGSASCRERVCQEV